MQHRNAITFTCWEKDEPIDICLEPEAFMFKVLPENELRFEGINSAGDFKWIVRVDHHSKSIQLFPQTSGSFDVEVFENGTLIW